MRWRVLVRVRVQRPLPLPPPPLPQQEQEQEPLQRLPCALPQGVACRVPHRRPPLRPRYGAEAMATVMAMQPAALPVLLLLAQVPAGPWAVAQA